MKNPPKNCLSLVPITLFITFPILANLTGCESQPVALEGARVRWVKGSGRFACTTLQAFQGIYERFEAGDSRGAANRKAIQKDANNLALLKPKEEVRVLREKDGYVLISLENRERTFWTHESWLVSEEPTGGFSQPSQDTEGMMAPPTPDPAPDNTPDNLFPTTPSPQSFPDKPESTGSSSLNPAESGPTGNTSSFPNMSSLLTDTGGTSTSPVEITKPIDLSANRNWTTSSGFKFTGSVRNLTNDSAVFLNSETGQERQLPLDSFCESDRALLKSAYYIEEDTKQYQAASSVIQNIASNPAANITTLKQLHMQHPDSPYAGVWLGACVSASENKHAEASTILRQVQERIEKQREFTPFRHAMTLASTLNNMAVCMIKAHKFDSAAGLLSRALDEAPTKNPVIVRNANGLLSTKIAGESAVNPNMQDRLTESLLSRDALEPATRALNAAPEYALDSDRPDTAGTTLPLGSFRPPHNSADLLGNSTGIAISGTTIICSASALGLRPEISGDSSYTNSDPVSDKEGDQFSILYINQSLGLAQTTDCKILEIDFLRDLVALSATRDTATFYPVYETAASISDNDDIASFAFDTRDSELTPRSLRSQKAQLDSTEPTILFESESARSGPILCKDGQLLGVSSNREGTNQFALTPSSEFIQFCSKHIPALSSTKINEPDQFRKSCVQVLRWSVIDEESPKHLSKFGQHANAKFAMPDPWCIPCQGTNWVACGRCTRGVTTVSKRVIIGRNPITNEDIWGNKTFKTPCGTCGGKGGSTCTFCSNGRRR